MHASKRGWTTAVNEMAGRGAEGTDEEFTQVVDYLAAHFGKPVNVNKATTEELRDGLSLSAR